MAIIKTRHFHSTLQGPKSPPDGTSLEEQMNAFLETLTVSMVVDIQTAISNTSTSSIMYSGIVVFQE